MKTEEAAICPDISCGGLWNMRERRDCPYCGATSYYPLARLLDKSDVSPYASEKLIHETFEDWPLTGRLNGGMK